MNNKYNYFTVVELQDYLKIGHNAAYALMTKKGFPSFKLGKKYLVEEEDLHEYLMKHKEEQINLIN